mmetsp:Transcript_832/g.2170  ORF Transcript_832/g.2170 Transcript_832/m.2170 type:complete len:203 (+) Transcript_832:120-728(+)
MCSCATWRTGVRTSTPRVRVCTRPCAGAHARLTLPRPRGLDLLGAHARAMPCTPARRVVMRSCTDTPPGARQLSAEPPCVAARAPISATGTLTLPAPHVSLLPSATAVAPPTAVALPTSPAQAARTKFAHWSARASVRRRWLHSPRQERVRALLAARIRGPVTGMWRADETARNLSPSAMRRTRRLPRAYWPPTEIFSIAVM